MAYWRESRPAGGRFETSLSQEYGKPKRPNVPLN